MCNIQPLKITPIGGSHPVLISEFKKFNIKGTFFTNARSALYSLIKTLNPNSIWMPSYLCESLLHNDYKIKFYEVDEDLNINKNFLKNIKENDAVLIINYFGINPKKEIFEEIKNKKAISIEDAAQALFSPGDKADYTIYSLTKMIGIPDGGILKSKNKIKFNLNKPDFNHLCKKIEYKFLRKSFNEGYENNWYDLYLQSKNESVGFLKISNFSKELLNYTNTDLIKTKNIENFNFLSKKLKPLINPNEKEIPLGFPIKIKNKEEVLKNLIENKIYPAIHWKLSKVPKKYEKSYQLSNEELTIPCDWRYSIEDMERILKCLSRINLKFR